MRSIRRRTELAWPYVVARAATIALVSLAGVTGCKDNLAAPIPAAHPSEETPRRGGTLHLASFGDMRSLDPAVAADALAAGAIRLIYAGLVEYDQTGNIVGDLAKWFEIDGDGTTYRFYLHEGVRMHDGEELTAADVKRSIERALHPTTPSPVASFYERIAGFDEYTTTTTKGAEHLAGVTEDGRYVVSIHLREPDATFLRVLALTPLRVVCKSAGARYADGFAPCGAGPFKLLPGGWDRGRALTLVRHEGYFRPGLPHLDAVNWSFSMNVITERFRFERGDLDIIHDLTQPDALRYQTDPRWKPFGEYEPERTISGEAMNTELPPFDNVEVRRAVASAIDRDHLVLIKASSLRAATQPIPPSVPGFDPDIPGQRYDYAAALEHMKNAGLAFDPKTGKGGWPETITYPIYKMGLWEQTGQDVAQDLAKIGLRLELKTLSYPTFLALSRRRGKTQISPQAWTQDYPDASDFFEPVFASKAINDEDSNNPSFYKNAKLDALLDRARRELDPAERKRLYAEATRIVCDDAPWAFTYSVRFYDVHQPYVRGYRIHPVWQQDVARTWIDRAAARIASGEGVLGRLGHGSILGGAR
jgi:ABC-type transport system substrate-binding protein